MPLRLWVCCPSRSFDKNIESFLIAASFTERWKGPEPCVGESRTHGSEQGGVEEKERSRDAFAETGGGDAEQKGGDENERQDAGPEVSEARAAHDNAAQYLQEVGHRQRV